MSYSNRQVSISSTIDEDRDLVIISVDEYESREISDLDDTSSSSDSSVEEVPKLAQSYSPLGSVRL